MEHRQILSLLGASEPVSAWTHFLGALLLFLLSRPLTAMTRGDARRTLAVRLYVLGVGGMFLASGTYHALEPTHPWRPVLWYLDHGMIWAAIGSTIAAVHVLAHLTPRWLAGLIWALCIGCAVIETLFLEHLPPWVSPLLYISVGWVGVIPMVGLIRDQGWEFAAPVLWAGLTSTLGGLIDALEHPTLIPGVVEAHEVMHVFILLGMGQFYAVVYRCASLEPHPEDAHTELAPEFAWNCAR